MRYIPNGNGQKHDYMMFLQNDFEKDTQIKLYITNKLKKLKFVTWNDLWSEKVEDPPAIQTVDKNEVERTRKMTMKLSLYFRSMMIDRNDLNAMMCVFFKVGFFSFSFLDLLVFPKSIDTNDASLGMI